MTARPKLLLQNGSVYSRPIEMEKNAEHILSLPVDGVTVNTPESFYFMRPGYVVEEAALRNWLERISDINAQMEDNILMAFSSKPGDLFDDAAWDQVFENVALLAKVAKDTNFAGIMFDNEEYFGTWQNFPEDYPGADPEDEARYIGQAVLRGKQFMEAIESEFPEAEVYVNHGPYESIAPSDLSPDVISRKQWGHEKFELRGPFFTGMLEGKGDGQTLVDNGQLYHARSVSDFTDSLNYRQDTLPDLIDWPIPQELRDNWDAEVVQSHSIITQEWPAGFEMDPEILEDTLVNAFQHSEEVVILYSDAQVHQWGNPGHVPEAWVDAVISATQRADAIFDGETPVDPTPPTEPEILQGTPEDDQLFGTSDDDVISGLEGNDILTGRNGADHLIGGEGDDTIIGGADNDLLEGGDGLDQLFGGQGADRLVGGAGNDLMNGGLGDDVLFGGASDDRLIGFDGDDQLNGEAGDDILHGGNGNDLMTGGAGSDRLSGGSGADVISAGDADDSIWGGDGNDAADGGDGNDRLQGNLGDDLLIGGNGDDHMQGGSGDDVLNGGTGNDLLVGGIGSDHFLFSAVDGNDRIADFEDGVDVIALQGIAFEEVDLSTRGNHTVMTYDGGEVLLLNVDAERVTIEDFEFG